MISFYFDNDGTKHEVDKETLNFLQDWVGMELVKLGCMAEQTKIPCEVIFTLFSRMVENTIAELLGGTEDEN